jgi:dTDP-4-amino-4,6-dideoxygalactose transaminase
LLSDGLKNVKGLIVPVPAEDVRSAYYRFTLFADKKQLNSGWNRDRIVDAINRDGVPCFQGACTEIYREKSFLVSGLAPEKPLPIAREFGESNFCLLVHPTLNDDDMDRAVEVVKRVMAAASA